MKHAANKVAKTRKSVPKAPTNLVESAPKISNPKTSKSLKEINLKIEKKPNVAVFQTKKPKAKTVQSAVVASRKLKANVTKTAPVASDKKVRQNKTVPVISLAKSEAKKSVSKTAPKPKIVIAKSKTSEQIPKPLNVSALKKRQNSVAAPTEKSINKKKSQAKTASPAPTDVNLKSKNKKINSVVSVVKSEAKKEKIISFSAAQKNTLAKKSAKILLSDNSEAKVSKKKPFVAINKITVIKKKTDLLNEKIENKAKTAKAKLPIAPREEIPGEAEFETKIASRKSKPKKAKPIGAAVFRGKKERYDFQVYPIDAEMENISAIYVISKRKIDKLKRGHHALVCIGQTDSIASEIKKHKSKCIKKHNANVISILPEASEKKRLKIEEDLKAAHTIACGF